MLNYWSFKNSSRIGLWICCVAAQRRRCLPMGQSGHVIALFVWWCLMTSRDLERCQLQCCAHKRFPSVLLRISLLEIRNTLLAALPCINLQNPKTSFHTSEPCSGKLSSFGALQRKCVTSDDINKIFIEYLHQKKCHILTAQKTHKRAVPNCGSICDVSFAWFQPIYVNKKQPDRIHPPKNKSPVLPWKMMVARGSTSLGGNDNFFLGQAVKLQGCMLAPNASRSLSCDVLALAACPSPTDLQSTASFLK